MVETFLKLMISCRAKKEGTPVPGVQNIWTAPPGLQIQFAMELLALKRQ